MLIMKLWIIRACWGVLAIIVLTTMVGVVYEIAARNRAVRDFPPPGKLVDIGGRRIQIDCRGSGSPTVVFESGLDIYGSLSWSTVHDEIAKTTRACAYSRAGIMWSDPNEAPQSGKAIADDLHATLRKAGESKPFVLVGHSLGGPYIMTYTKYFGADVAGLVFVDAAHPDQKQRLDAVAKIEESKLIAFRDKVGVLLNWTGVVRAVVATYQNMPNQPESVHQTMKAYASTSFGPMLKESQALAQTLAEAGTFRQLVNRPILVLTAMAPIPEQVRVNLGWTKAQAKQFQDGWKQLHDEQATWSSRSQHQLIPDASHYIQFDRPDIVIAAVQSVVASVRAQRK